MPAVPELLMKVCMSTVTNKEEMERSGEANTKCSIDLGTNLCT